MPLSISYPESRTIQCAEGCSTDSLTSAESSSIVVHCVESGPLFNFRACQSVQCHAIPPMQYWVEYVLGQNLVVQCMDAYSVDGTPGGDTSFSASCSSDGS